MSELASSGFTMGGLAAASDVPFPLLREILGSDDGRATKANCRRVLRGLSILTGRRCSECDFVEDLGENFA
jgi:hypothetical protein